MDKIVFNWYAKDTASGRLMNFNATQPRNQIVNTAKNFIERVLKISDKQFHTENRRKIQQILKENSFPNKLIETLIDDVIRRLKNICQRDNTDDKEEKLFYSVQYIPGLTDKRNLKTTIDHKNICFAYKPNSTLSPIFTNVKAPIDKEQQNNVVYQIQCNGNDTENCELIYIGTTKRALGIRMGEHKTDIEKQKESTALVKHVINTGHRVDFSTVKIIDKENREKKRYTKESLHIQKNINRTVNLKEDTNNINTSYILALK